MLRWADGGPAKNRDGLNADSDDSSWSRINRHYQDASKWYQEVEARWSVDADDYEQWSYHLQPLNTVEYSYCSVSLLDKARKLKLNIRQLRGELLALVRRQEALWTTEWSKENKKEWNWIEREISQIKHRLLHKYGEYVQAGSNRKFDAPERDAEIDQDAA